MVVQVLLNDLGSEEEVEAEDEGVLYEALLLSNIHGVLYVVYILFELFIIHPKSKSFEH